MKKKINRGSPLEELVKGSVDYTMQMIRDAFWKQFPDASGQYYIAETFADHVIISGFGDGWPLKADEYYKVNYSKSGQGDPAPTYTFAAKEAWEVVELAYQPQTPLSPSTAMSPPMRESAEFGGKKRKGVRFEERIEAVAVLEEAQEAISALIKRLHHLSKEQEDSFQIRNMADIRSALETTTKTMRILLGSIAAISLLVGGIGIMNIMLVAVTERTREIGLRKAIGAAEGDILMQFLCESVLLSLIGGGLGIGLGFFIAMLMVAIAGWAIQVSLFSILLASIFSFVVGVVFGLWPARQAARLNPIEALRYE